MEATPASKFWFSRRVPVCRRQTTLVVLGGCFLLSFAREATTNPGLQLQYTIIPTGRQLPAFSTSIHQVVNTQQEPLRLRGGQHVINQIPEPVQPPEGYDNSFNSVEGEGALRSAEEALAAGEFGRARTLRKKAIVHFVEECCISKFQDVLAKLGQQIDASEAQLNSTADLKDPEPAYWSVSPHLNLTREQLEALEGWVQRPVLAERALYLSSQHGFDSRRFHKLCDHKGPTVTLVRTDTGHVFGGYTSVPWTKGTLASKPPRWEVKVVEDRAAFVFRLTAPPGWKAKSYDDIFNISYDDKVIGGAFWNQTGDFNISYRDPKPNAVAPRASFGEEPTEEEHGRGAAAAAAAAAEEPRWGLDVAVPGIVNQTDAAMPDATAGTEERAGADRDAMSDGDPEGSEGGGAAEAWASPALCRASLREPELPQVRHVASKGPCFTHALELDLDNPGRSFSDLLSGAIYDMPDEVPDADERVFLAGKIGGREFEEKDHPDARWWIKEVAVIAV